MEGERQSTNHALESISDMESTVVISTKHLGSMSSCCKHFRTDYGVGISTLVSGQLVRSIASIQERPYAGGLLRP